MLLFYWLEQITVRETAIGNKYFQRAILHLYVAKVLCRKDVLAVSHAWLLAYRMAFCHTSTWSKILNLLVNRIDQVKFNRKTRSIKLKSTDAIRSIQNIVVNGLHIIYTVCLSSIKCSLSMSYTQYTHLSSFYDYRQKRYSQCIFQRTVFNMTMSVRISFSRIQNSLFRLPSWYLDLMKSRSPWHIHSIKNILRRKQSRKLFRPSSHMDQNINFVQFFA